MSGVEIRVRSNSKAARSDLNKLENSVKNIETKTAAAGKAFRNLAIGIGAAFSGGVIVKGINNATDSLTNLENRIALVTGRGKELDKTMNSLFNIAKKTRGDIGGSAETFNRFGIALKDSGKSADELLKAVTSVNKAVAISGSGAESARAALFQLGQGLASGQLRGQELNSVLEQAPRLAQAIADEMESPLGSLRKLAEAGKVTTDVVFNALINQADKLNSEFEQMEGTSEQAFSVMGDQISRVVGEISKATGITGVFTSRFNAIADAFANNREEIVLTVSTTINQLKRMVAGGGVVGNIFDGVLPLLKGIGSVMGAVIGRIADALPRVILPMRTLADDVGLAFANVFLTVQQKFRGTILDMQSAVRGVFGTGFEGEFRSLFQSASLRDFGENLEKLASSIDSYGRRWYNVGNLITRSIASANFELLKAGIYLGVVEQKLIRFRFTSFERLSKTFGVLNIFMQRFIKNILATKALARVKAVLISLTQAVVRFGDAVSNTFGGPSFATALNSGQKLFSGVYKSANKWLTPATKLVTDFAKTVERAFYWAYDEIIQNSWWTDTMEQTYALSEKYLGLTESRVTRFAQTMNSKFKGIYSQFKSSPKISSGLDAESLKVRFEGAAEQAKDLGAKVTAALGDAFQKSFKFLNQISPVLSTAVGTALVAGITKVLTPGLFKATFARIGPAAMVVFFAGAASELSRKLLDSGVFKALGDNLGTTLALGLNAVLDFIPILTKGLIQAMSSAGKAFAESVEGTFIGIPAKILGLVPGVGGLLTTLFYGTAGLAVFSSKFRGVIGSLVGSIATATGTGAAGGKGLGLLQTAMFGGSFTRFSKDAKRAEASVTRFEKKAKATSNAAQRSTLQGMAQTRTAAAANFTQLARSAKIAHLGVMGALSIGSVALFGDTVGTEISLLMGIAAGNAVNFALSNQRVQAMVRAQFLGTQLFVMKGSQKIYAAISTAFTGGATAAKTQLSGLSAVTATATTMMAASFAKVKAASVGAFAFFGKSKLAAILGGAALASVAFAGMGNASTGAAGDISSLGSTLGTTALTLASLAMFIPNLGKKFKAMGSAGSKAFKKISGSAAATKVASTTAAVTAKAGGAGSAALVAIASFAKDIGKFFAKIKWVALFGNGIKKLGSALMGAVRKVLGTALLTGLRSAIVTAFAGLAAIISAPILAAVAAVAVVGGIAYLAIFGAEETFLAKVKGTMKKVARFFNFSDDNTVGKGEAAQSIGRRVGQRGDLDKKVVEQLEDITFQSLNDRAAFAITDSLEDLQKLSDRANEERRTIGRVSDATAAKLLKAQKEATEAIKSGGVSSGQTNAENKSFTQDRFASIIEAAATPSLITRIGRNLASIFVSQDNNPEVQNEAQLKAFGESFRDAGFGQGEFQTVAALNKFQKGLEDGTSAINKEATQRRGFLNLFSGFLNEANIEVLGAAIDEINKNTVATGEGFQSGVGVSPALLNAIFAAMNEQEENRDIIGLGDPDDMVQALKAAIANEGNELFRLNKDLNENLVKASLSAYDFGTSLEDLAQLTLDERETIAAATVGVKAAEFELNNKLAERSAAGTKEEFLTANTKVEIELVRIEALQRRLKEVVEEAMTSGIASLSRSRFAAALENANVSETFAEAITFGIEKGIKNSAFEMPETLFSKVAQGQGRDEFEQVTAANSGNDNVAGLFQAQLDKDRNVRVQRLIEHHKQLTKEIARQVSLETKAQNGPRLFDPATLQASLDAQKKITEEINNIGSAMEALNVESSEVGGLLSQAAGMSTVKNIDMDKLYKVGPDTARKIAEVAVALQLLKAAAVDPAAADALGVSIQEIPDQIELLQKQLDKMFTSAPKVAPTETLFEKFVGGLNDSGFSIDINEAAALSKSAIQGMLKPLKAIEAAQKKIKNLGVLDNAGRIKSLALIKKQRAAIADLLMAGTVGQANVGLSGLGVDTSATTSEMGTNAALKIMSLQEDLNNTLFTDYATRKQISAEIEKQERLLDGLTTGAQASSDAVRDSIKESFGGLLKGTTTFKEAFFSTLDTISTRIIDTVVDSFTDALFQSAGLDTMFDSLFSGLFGGGSSLGEDVGSGVLAGVFGKKSASGDEDGEEAKQKSIFSGFAESIGGIFSDLPNTLGSVFEGFTGGFGDLLGGLGNSIGSLFGGGSGGGGGFDMGSLIMKGIGFLGFSQGGVVPSTSTSQAGKDSVPAMLMPGEVVMSKNSLRNGSMNQQSQTQTFSINVQGDVSRQTRKEIVKMMPQIASGVNRDNKEKGSR